MSNLSNLPPGLSTGVSYATFEVECLNGHRWTQHITREHDTNASYPQDGEEICPVCGEEPDDDWAESYDEPESQFDTIEEARGER